MENDEAVPSCSMAGHNIYCKKFAFQCLIPGHADKRRKPDELNAEKNSNGGGGRAVWNHAWRVETAVSK